MDELNYLVFGEFLTALLLIVRKSLFLLGFPAFWISLLTLVSFPRLKGVLSLKNYFLLIKTQTLNAREYGLAKINIKNL